MAELATVSNGVTALAIPNQEMVRDILERNMAGMRPEFDRIRIPPGGATTWEIPGDEDETTATKELVGVIICHYAVNAYWPEKTTSGVPPACASMDGKRGIGDPGGVCAVCPHNQWGSDVDGGRGKACKNMHRIFLLPEKQIFPWLLTLPPTSLRPFQLYVSRLSSKLKAVDGVITKITLERATSGGNAYSKCVFKRVGDLPESEARQIREYAQTLMVAMRGVSVETEDYAVAEEDETPF